MSQTMSRDSYVKLLEDAEFQYKLALALNTTYNSRDGEEVPELAYLTYFVYGRFWADRTGLRLTKEQEKRAIMLLEHSAVYLIAVQIDSVLQDNFPNRFQHSNNDIKAIACIIRLARNAFAHNPFAPVWLIDRKFRNKVYTINNLSFNTSGLNNKPVRRRDYGGPLALLWFSQFVRNLL